MRMSLSTRRDPCASCPSGPSDGASLLSVKVVSQLSALLSLALRVVSSFTRMKLGPYKASTASCRERPGTARVLEDVGVEFPLAAVAGVVLAVMLVVGVGAAEVPVGLGQERVLELTHALHAAGGRGERSCGSRESGREELALQRGTAAQTPVAHAEPMSRRG